MSHFLFHVFSLLFLAGQVVAQKQTEEKELGAVFEKHGLEGCFVVLNPVTSILHVYNPARAARGFLPASTFKIPMALMGLDTGTVKDVDEVIPYGGTKEWLKDWERDMNLKEAMKLSNVAIFHQVARRVGMDRMQECLRLFDYGNQQTGDDVGRRYWLEGPMAISALQQVDFLRRLTGGEIPLKKRTLESVKEITLYESQGGATIYAKTGWSGSTGQQVGWWVGWVEKDGRNFPFALNATVPTMAVAKKRIPVALECLAALWIWNVE
ncbi:penicillin-binding transpeptidase domain-containing protein [Prosthecobacter sp. SYSU 5D2]|uniref:penicillin-binding transpeptidase domain-containing protein n=1 Tax=Prosthecobacter sp. SYSU 5D2 TaxID=3134134 RepID=UPI0031FE639A